MRIEGKIDRAELRLRFTWRRLHPTCGTLGVMHVTSRGDVGSHLGAGRETMAASPSAIEFEAEVGPHAFEKSQQSGLFIAADALERDATKPVRRL